ncbi:MAG: hypothetical protein ACM3TU_03385 [Bacillota bacterium]
MRIVRVVMATCAVIYAFHTEAEGQTTPPVTEVAASDHPETKRSIAVYYATLYAGADQPFRIVDPFIVEEDQVDERVRELSASDVIVEVCSLVEKADGRYGPPPPILKERERVCHPPGRTK